MVSLIEPVSSYQTIRSARVCCIQSCASSSPKNEIRNKETNWQEKAGGESPNGLS